MALGFNPHELTDMIKNMALPAAKAQAANQTRQAQEEKRAKKLAKEQEKIKSSRGGDVRPSNGLSSSDLPPAPPEFLPTSNGTVEPGYRLIWEDQFNGDTLDSTKWQIESDCRRQELQCYTAKPWNVYVDKGRLFLHAKAHPDGFRPDPTDPCTRSEDCIAKKQYTSGRIRTKGRASWRYGRIEIRARMPKGEYLWPTLWMLPAQDVHGDWAASGEIDLIETTGNDPTAFSSTIHYGGVPPDNKFESSGVQSLVNDDNEPVDLSAKFHLYRLDWTPNRLQTFFDGHKVLDIDLDRRFGDIYKKNGAPFDEEFYLIMNLAVGGEFFGPDADKLTTKTALAWQRPFLEVDYVRVFEKLANATSIADESVQSSGVQDVIVIRV
ncbi:unnamed protein product (mitochondrion) [Plasmodiophora brassicae]|uniref:GH16 domain-containing protein n=1 Tax=Plasmodiophora brassicae TaxID=37360 RepID=A0A3P3YF42_PLABS|nr:unnamed protein product [Plasmodiophora brassicae]